MKLNKYFKLKNQLEIQPFQSSFSTLKEVLYYFSFLGNLFLILFGYFFIKNVTDSIPPLFSNQTLFFGVFVALFLTGYELFKRFALEQLVVNFLRVKKLTINNFFGLLVGLGLIAGSFYLSLNGAHRLIDNTEIITTATETKQVTALDSVAQPYNKKIEVYQSQLDKVLLKSDTNGTYNKSQRKLIAKYEVQIKQLEQERDQKVKQTDSLLQIKLGSKQETQLAKNTENDTAFVFMTFFLELIILLGVGFHGYYTINSFLEMKSILSKNPSIEYKYKLINLAYTNRKIGDALPTSQDLINLMGSKKMSIDQVELAEFADFMIVSNLAKDGIISKSREQAIKELEKMITE